MSNYYSEYSFIKLRFPCVYMYMSTCRYISIYIYVYSALTDAYTGCNRDTREEWLGRFDTLVNTAPAPGSVFSDG